MSEQFLHRANIVPIFQKMRGEAVAEGILTLPMNRPQPSFTTVTIPSTANT